MAVLLSPKTTTKSSISHLLTPEEYYSLGKSPIRHKSYIKNTVLVANQLLDSIERDVKESKEAVLSKEQYIDRIEQENGQLKAQIIQYKVRNLTSTFYKKRENN